MVSNIALWSRVACFTLDDPEAAFQFTERLARENGWSRAFAKGAVEEYKKFVYLAAISADHVTPSDIVDQVWHLHLTFTRSYWNDLCGAVLQKDLHHMPTKGGAAEAARYRAQYDATLSLYGREFGDAAPAAFWPEPRARFSSLVHHAWVDRRSHWVVAKPDWRGWLAGLTAALATAGVASAAEGDKNGSDTTTIVIGGVMAAALVLFALLTSQSRRPRRRSKEGSGDGSPIVATDAGSSGGGKGKGNDGGEGGGEGGGDGGGGCGGGGCGS